MQALTELFPGAADHLAVVSELEVMLRRPRYSQATLVCVRENLLRALARLREPHADLVYEVLAERSESYSQPGAHLSALEQLEDQMARCTANALAFNYGSHADMQQIRALACKIDDIRVADERYGAYIFEVEELLRGDLALTPSARDTLLETWRMVHREASRPLPEAKFPPPRLDLIGPRAELVEELARLEARRVLRKCLCNTADADFSRIREIESLL